MASNGPPGLGWEDRQRAQRLLRLVDPDYSLEQELQIEENQRLLDRERAKQERREKLLGFAFLALIGFAALLASCLWELLNI